MTASTACQSAGQAHSNAKPVVWVHVLEAQSAGNMVALRKHLEGFTGDGQSQSQAIVVVLEVVFWKELMHAYRDAKVLLTVRDDASKSVQIGTQYNQQSRG